MKYVLAFWPGSNSEKKTEKKKKHPSWGEQCKLHARTPLTMKKETGLLYNTKLKHDRTSNMAKNNELAATSTAAALLPAGVAYAKLHWAMSKLSWI